MLANHFYKIIFLSLIFLIICSCDAQKITSKDTAYNTDLNKEYRKSNKKIRGRFKIDEYDSIKCNIEKLFKIEIPHEKSILINFSQNGRNCRMLSFSKDKIPTYLSRMKKISNQYSKEYDLNDFFIFTKDSPFCSILKNMKKAEMDNGFFAKEIFTYKKNCGAFLLIGPNRKYIQYYGEDYYTEIQNSIEHIK